jgi:hypothetical protein
MPFAPTTPPPASTPILLPINVKNYGARGDGVTPDDAAIRLAIATAVGLGKPLASNSTLISYVPSIYFPPGNYLTAQPGTFNPTVPVGNSIQGLAFVGDAYGNTQITVSAATYAVGPTDWLFNNLNLASLVSFKNIQFVGGTGTEQCMYFACTAGGRVYDSRFEDCDFRNFAQALLYGGSQNTSENKFTRTSFFLGPNQTGITIDNEQSVNFDFNVLNVGANGGGTFINLMQGGFIKARDINASLLGGGVLLQTQPPNAGIGRNNDGIFFDGMRCEVSGAAQVAVVQNSFRMTIQNSMIGPVLGAYTGTTGHLAVTNGSTIKCKNCIYDPLIITFGAGVTFDSDCSSAN